jgi:hypothetical protein
MKKQIMTKEQFNNQIQFEDSCGVNTTLQEYFSGDIEVNE